MRSIAIGWCKFHGTQYSADIGIGGRSLCKTIDEHSGRLCHNPLRLSSRHKNQRKEDDRGRFTEKIEELPVEIPISLPVSL